MGKKAEQRGDQNSSNLPIKIGRNGTVVTPITSKTEIHRKMATRVKIWCRRGGGLTSAALYLSSVLFYKNRHVLDHSIEGCWAYNFQIFLSGKKGTFP